MQKLLTVAEMRSIEREADSSGLTYAAMMENAGKSLALWVNARYHQYVPRSVAALVGSGNNGGDALVALTKLIELGWVTAAYLARSRDASDELMLAYTRMGGIVIEGYDDADRRRLDKLIEHTPVLIDGVLGTGIKLPLAPDLAEILKYVSAKVRRKSAQISIVAVDCPSGVDCDSGDAAQETIPADATVTMAGVKTGLLKFPAANLVGDLVVGRIGQLDSLETWKRVQRGVLEDADVAAGLPRRGKDAHKGSFGTALIVAGSGNYSGAALLAGEAAYRIGAGLVTLAIPELIHAALAGCLPEATWVSLPHRDGWISEAGVSPLNSTLGRANALLIGPGLGVVECTEIFVHQLAKSRLPAMVIDADGLKLVARLPEWYTILPDNVVLTPHLGEMAVLTGLPIQEIQNNRIEVAEEYSKRWKKVVVLKGAYTVIACQGNDTLVVPVATPALARAGTGDVLAGVIVGLLAQGVSAHVAAYTGAYIHAQAGLLAEKQLGNPASVLAGDVLRQISHALTGLMNTKIAEP